MELDARESSVRAKDALGRQRESEVAERGRKLDEREARVTACATMLQDRDAALDDRESRLRAKEVAASRRAEELIVTFAAVEELKRDSMKAADEQAATGAARLRAWEVQLGCTEALLAERELEIRRCADQLRVATAEVEEKQRAAAELEAILTERARSSTPARQTAPVVASASSPAPVVSIETPSVAAAEIVEVPKSVHTVESAEAPKPVVAVEIAETPKAVVATETVLEGETLVEADLAPTVDISDFSAEEVAQFNVRRRLGLRNDATLAAEIRSERTPSKKKGWWF
jgi:hypothetical protein